MSIFGILNVFQIVDHHTIPSPAPHNEYIGEASTIVVEPVACWALKQTLIIWSMFKYVDNNINTCNCLKAYRQSNNTQNGV